MTRGGGDKDVNRRIQYPCDIFTLYSVKNLVLMSEGDMTPIDMPLVCCEHYYIDVPYPSIM